MYPHNVPWLIMEDLHLSYFMVDPYMASDVMMKLYRALWNKKAPTQKKQRRRKKGKEQQEERTNIQPRDNAQRDNTQNCKCTTRGHNKRVRERKQWNELLWRFFVHSFIPFISSLTFSHPKMSSIQKWPINLPTKETQLRSRWGVFFSFFSQ
jgi:hypothetical protein